MTFLDKFLIALVVIALIIMTLATVVVGVKYIADTYFYKEMKKLERKNEELEMENFDLRFRDMSNSRAAENAYSCLSAENLKLRAELSDVRRENGTLKAELDEARRSGGLRGRCCMAQPVDCCRQDK